MKLDTGRLGKIIAVLEKTYKTPPQSDHEDPVDCLIRTVLSQNTNDVNRDRAFDSMIDRFKTWEGVLKADVRSIAASIKAGGLSNTKSKRIKEILKSIKSERGKIELDFLRGIDTDQTEQKLLTYPGVGLKTARCVQIFSLGQATFPVDTHIFRITKRLGLIAGKTTPEQAHQQLGRAVSQDKMYTFHINLIKHGRKLCRARNPLCPQCPLLSHCPYGKKQIQ
jgi:endonuclease III